MSWDIYIQDIPPDAKSISDIPDDFRPSAIGERTQLIESIQQVCPEADFSDPSHGRIEGTGFSMGLSMGDSETCTGIALFIHGGGDEAAYLVHDILAKLGLRAFDTGNGGFFSLEGGSLEGLARWRAYRDSLRD
ncbi:MAG: hypothetical protein AAGG01_05020 [Planctomycetota bacterium]